MTDCRPGPDAADAFDDMFPDPPPRTGSPWLNEVLLFADDALATPEGRGDLVRFAAAVVARDTARDPSAAVPQEGAGVAPRRPHPGEHLRRRWSNCLVRLSGARPDILDEVPEDRFQYVVAGLSVIGVGIFSGMCLAFGLIAGAGLPTHTAVVTSLLWGTTLVWVDRTILTGSAARRLLNGRPQLRLAVPRLVMSVVTAVAVVAPIVPPFGPVATPFSLAVLLVFVIMHLLPLLMRVVAAPTAHDQIFERRRLQSAVNGRWVIESPLEQADVGGFGEVFMAHEIGRSSRRPRRPVVVKRQRARTQIQQEMLFMAAVESRHVAPLLDGGVDDDFGSFLVTPYYTSTVSRKLQEKDFIPTLGWSLKIVEQILVGLVDCWNSAAMVHLDVKPGNVALDARGDVRLLDFGLATELLGGRDECVEPERAVFTKWYAAPEQAERRPHWLTSGCDVRATFALWYEILTGRPPLYREAVERGLVDERGGAACVVDGGELMRLITTGEPVPPAVLVPGIPQIVDDLVVRGLHPDPGRRAFSSAKDVVEVLGAVRQLRERTRDQAGVEVGLRRVRSQEAGAGPDSFSVGWTPDSTGTAGLCSATTGW